MIIIAVGTGFTVSIIPNITHSLVKGNYKDIKNKINKTFKDYSKYVETFKINNQGSNKKKEKISLVKFKGWELSKEKEL